MFRAISLASILSLTLAGANGARAAVVEETIDLPVAAANARGRIERRPIKVTIFRDDTPQARSPFLVLNHGRASNRTRQRMVTAASFAPVARYLVTKGFTVLVPVRIGYGATGGPDIENSGACATRNFPPAYEAATRQSLVSRF